MPAISLQICDAYQKAVYYIFIAGNHFEAKIRDISGINALGAGAILPWDALPRA